MLSSSQPAMFTLSPSQAALFFDIDGTLALIAPTPGAAAIPPQTLSELMRLKQVGAAIALVSGRTIEDVDRMCAPYRFCVAGQHGLEIREEDGQKLQLTTKQELLSAMAENIEEFHRQHPLLLIEYKGLSIAVHYRAAPEWGEEVEAFLTGLMETDPESLFLQKGKMVCELRLSGSSKGGAIRYLMSKKPFSGRIPVFAGDDHTDESGFEAVNELNGMGIKIGEGSTLAQYRMDNPEQLQEWLSAF